MPVALEQFVKQLENSGVIAPGKLENFVPPKAQPKDAQELARQLILKKQLTKYQVQEIYQGRSKWLILGNYTILDKIGAGGMGQVFKAEHRRMHRTVAIKMLPPAVTKDLAAVARFQREVEAAAKLRHTNIVAADDADEAGGVHFLVMEYAEGSDLSALVKKNGPFSVAQSVNYIQQAARGLEYAHKHGVIHRDIKPANLLLNSEGTVKVLDMGLARIESDGDAGTQAELTGTGAIMGTVDYMAPEQGLSTKHADARADIYSLGCTLHYLLTGKATYEGETVAAKLLAHHTRPIPDLHKLRDDVPAELEAVFQKMVAKKVEDRYQTMSEVVAELEECAAVTSTVRKPQTTSESSSNNANLSFLADATAHTQHHKPTKQVKPIKKEAKPAKKSSGSNRKKLLLVGGGILGGLILLAGIIFKMQTKDGTLVVEINQPDAVVQVLDAEGKVEITQPGRKGSISVSVDPGKHRLKVKKDGFQFFAKDFEIDSGGTASIKATLEPMTAVAGQSDKLWNSSAFQRWMKDVAAMPAEKQVEAVSKKLQELNPGFDGKVTDAYKTGTPKIENNVITEIGFFADNVTDVSPVRALAGLKVLTCIGSSLRSGQVSDLSPLHGMSLTTLLCWYTQVSDLSPLQGMALTRLDCGGTKVSDLTPLKGMPLKFLNCNNVAVFDLSPLRDLPLEYLGIYVTPVSDLSPLKEKNLTAFLFTPENIKTGMDVIHQMKSLQTIGIGSEDESKWPTVKFWQKYDAGEFGKPAAAAKSTLDDPAFQKWMKDVAAQSPEEQVKAVVKRLQELNRGFDGNVTPTIGDGSVVGLKFSSGQITDLSPLRALAQLRSLECASSWGTISELSDLAPLKGLPLNLLDVQASHVADLTPLKGMPLTKLRLGTTQASDLEPLQGMHLELLNIGTTNVADLTSLRGMRLKTLYCDQTKVSDIRPLAGMPLEELTLFDTKVPDLSPLKGAPLQKLYVYRTPTTDLSPLKGMQLKVLCFSPREIRSGIGIARGMQSLEQIGVDFDTRFAPADFWKKYDAGEFGKPATAAKSTLDDPAFQQWMKTVAAMPAEQQLEAVAKKLQELNPGFDGKVTGWDGNGPPKIENGVVTELRFVTDNVTDISPIRALKELKFLRCIGSIEGQGKLSDLSPLRGMKLRELDCGWSQVVDLSPLKEMKLTYLTCGGSQVADLSPLEGMPLTNLDCGRSQVSELSPLQGMPLIDLWITYTRVSDLSPLKGLHLTDLNCGETKISDLSPLKGMPLRNLSCPGTPVSDLSPLHGMPLSSLECPGTKVSDLSPLEGMHLTEIYFNPKKISKGLEVVRRMQSVKKIGPERNESRFPPVEFWKKYDAGEFGKPDSPNAAPSKPITTFNDPAFQQWLKTVSALPAEQQVESVAKKLQELNPGFDGKEVHKIEGGVVTELNFYTVNVTDISPVRALVGLKSFNCGGGGQPGMGKLSDLSPLEGMGLTNLKCQNTRVSDLSPLKGMPLTELNLRQTLVVDLSPLRGMPSLANLGFENSPVSDLSPLEGMALTVLDCESTKVSDLSPLRGMKLSVIAFTPKNITKGIEAIRQIKSLGSIGTDWDHLLPTAEFWKKYDASDFNK